MSNNDIEIRVKAKAEGGEEVQTLGGQMKALGGEIDKLSKNADDVSAYQKLEKEMAETGKASQAAQDKIKNLSEEIKKQDDSNIQMAASLNTAKEAVSQFKKAVDDEQASLSAQRKRVKESSEAYKEARSSLSGLAEEMKGQESVSQEMNFQYKETKEKVDSLKKAFDEEKIALQDQKLKVAGASSSYKEATVTLKDVSSNTKEAGLAQRKLVADFEATKKETDSLNAKYEKQGKALGDLGDSLRKNGVDTGNLASEQNRLQKELQDSQTSLLAIKRISDSMSLLGFKPHPEIKQEIDKLKNAYEEIRKTGTLSSTELAQAQLKLKEKMSELAAQTNGWKESLLKAKDGLIAFGASLAVFGAAAKQAIQFEDAMGEVRKTLDATPQQMQKITDDIKEMSRSMPMAAEGLAKIAATGGQLGIAQKDIKGFTELAAKMGTAFDISAEEAGNAVGKMMNVLGLGIKDVELLGDAINKLGNATAAKEKDIVDVMVKVGSAGKMFGLTAQQTAALGDAFLALGRPVDVSSTAINGMLAKLQTAREGSKDMQDALARLGISADRLASDINAKPQEALLGFLKTLEKLDKQSRSEIMIKIFGLEYQDDIGALVGSLGEYEKALGLIGKQSDYAGSMTEEYKKRLEATSAQLQLLKNSVTEIAVNFGELLLPSVKWLAEKFSGLSGLFADFVKEAPALTVMAAGFVSVKIAGDSLAKALDAGKLVLYGFRDGLVEWTKTANQSFTTAAQGLGKIQTGFSVLAAGMIGWEVGQWLSREFETARIAGAALTEGLIRGWEGVRYGYELFLAVFTNDTVDAVTERHLARVKEMEAGFVYMYDQAEKGGDKAKKKLEETGEAGKKAGDQIKDGADKAKEGITGLIVPLETTAEILQKKFGVDSKEALTGLDSKFQEMTESFQGLAKNAEVSGNELFAAFQKMRESANSTQEYKKLDDILKQLGNSGKVSGEQVDYAFREMGVQAVRQLIEEIGKADDAFEFDKIKADMENLYQSGVISSKQYGAAMDQLRAKTEGTSEAIKEVKETTEAAADETEDHTKQVEKSTEAAKDETDALKKKAKVLEDEAKLLEDSAKLHEQKAKAAESQFKAEKAALEQAKTKLELAESTGTATAKEISALERQIEQLEKAAAASKKLAVEQKELAEDTGKAADELMNQAEKLKKSADEMENLESRTISVASAGNLLADNLKDLSEEIYNAVYGLDELDSGFHSLRTNAYDFAKSFEDFDFSSMDSLKQKITEVDDLLLRTSDAQGRRSLENIRTMLTEAQTVSKLEGSYTGMFASLEAGGYFSASAMYDLNSQAEKALSRIKFLDEERLENLKDSINEAKDAMNEFRNAALEAEQALQEMATEYQDELDELAGNKAAIENRRHEKELDRLKELYETAGTLGRDEYEKAVKLADQIHEKKLQQINEQAAASKAALGNGSGTSGTGSGSGSGSTSSGSSSYIDEMPYVMKQQIREKIEAESQTRAAGQSASGSGRSAVKTVELRFNINSGETVAGSFSEDAAELLIGQLKRARMVS